MDAPKAPPSVFANRVIRQIVDHLFGQDLVIEPADFLKLRLIYRRLGGTWSDLMGGDLKALKLLEKVLTRWGQVPSRKREPRD